MLTITRPAHHDKLRSTILALFILSAAIVTARSQQYTPALVPSGYAASGTSIDSTRGYSFDVTSPTGIVVSALSVGDFGGDGLGQSHAVGLWNASGTLLASVTVPAGTAAPLDSSGLFRYVPITSLTLPQGTNYVVGAFFVVGSPDGQFYGWSSLSTAPGINFDQDRYVNNTSLTFPTGTQVQFGAGLVGGSLELTVTPEPSACALLALGLPLFVTLQRRRTSRRVPRSQPPQLPLH
jgi:hypothetical protein